MALGKLWVTQCGCIWLCTNFSMGITIENFWKIFHYGVNIEHYDRCIGIKESLEQLDLDFFNNIFPTDIGNPSNNIPILDEANGVDIVSNHLCIEF